MVEEHPKAKFEWRITRFAHGDLYTLIDWSDVKRFGDLPPEYTRYHGQKFWADGNAGVVLNDHVIGTLPKRYELKRGTVLEESVFKAVEAHLRAASGRLQSVNQTIKENSECITIEV